MEQVGPTPSDPGRPRRRAPAKSHRLVAPWGAEVLDVCAGAGSHVCDPLECRSHRSGNRRPAVTRMTSPAARSARRTTAALTVSTRTPACLCPYSSPTWSKFFGVASRDTTLGDGAHDPHGEETRHMRVNEGGFQQSLTQAPGQGRLGHPPGPDGPVAKSRRLTIPAKTSRQRLRRRRRPAKLR